MEFDEDRSNDDSLLSTSESLRSLNVDKFKIGQEMVNEIEICTILPHTNYRKV